MSAPTEYAAGTPSWIDHASREPGRAAEFYGALFGWEMIDRMPAETGGEYHVAVLRGKDVAACGSQPAPDAPPAWNTYFTVADAERAVADVAEAGGKVLIEPFDVFDAGRMAVCSDPEGAVFMVWKPIEMIGSQLVNEPGAPLWNELQTRDPESAREFYGRVFGWTDTRTEFGGAEYTIWHLAGEEGPLCGAMTMSAPRAQGSQTEAAKRESGAIGDDPATPPHWLVYIAVEDADATAARATELGGEVTVEPFDAVAGRLATLRDPLGAPFGIVRSTV